MKTSEVILAIVFGSFILVNILGSLYLTMIGGVWTEGFVAPITMTISIVLTILYYTFISISEIKDKIVTILYKIIVTIEILAISICITSYLQNTINNLQNY